MSNESESAPSWEEIRVMSHIMTRTPTKTGNNDVSEMPGVEKISPEFRERADQFYDLSGAFCQIGILLAELKMPVEPVHPLNKKQVDEFVSKKLKEFGISNREDNFGLTAISKTLVNSYYPTVDWFEFSQTDPDTDLELFDPFSGFVIWKANNKIRNYWLGNVPSLFPNQEVDPRLFKILVKNNSDHFSIGKSIWFRLVGRHMKKFRPSSLDQAEIPTIRIETQEELDTFVDEIRSAVASIPGLKYAFRGQTKEHLLPDRGPLVKSNICPYSNLRDHSLVPSMYRHFDSFLDDMNEFRTFIEHLREWSLYSDLVFGDPVKYVDYSGRPYKPQPAPKGRTTIAMYMSGGPHGKGPLRMFQDLGPYSTVEIVDDTERIIEQYIKLHSPGFDVVRRNLVLQHYGAPTPLIDVTKDVHVAEWFAFNQLNVGPDGVTKYSPYPYAPGSSVIYVFFMMDSLTPFVETEHLVDASVSLRPHRQACAVLGGAGNLYRNAISRFIGLKIKLSPSFRPGRLPDAEYLFPGPDEDPMLKCLLKVYRPAAGLSKQFPVYHIKRR